MFRGATITAEMVNMITGSAQLIEKQDTGKLPTDYTSYAWQVEGRDPTLTEKLTARVMDSGFGKLLRKLPFFK